MVPNQTSATFQVRSIGAVGGQPQAHQKAARAEYGIARRPVVPGSQPSTDQDATLPGKQEEVAPNHGLLAFKVGLEAQTFTLQELCQILASRC